MAKSTSIAAGHSNLALHCLPARIAAGGSPETRTAASAATAMAASGAADAAAHQAHIAHSGTPAKLAEAALTYGLAAGGCLEAYAAAQATLEACPAAGDTREKG